MHSFLRTISMAAMLASATNGQGIGVILKAQGAAGSPTSKGFQVSLTDPKDANIINKTEITDNITNECGRTLLNGNIDAGAVTEDALFNKTVTTVTKGSKVMVTINQGGPDGIGPYICDMDLTSNSGGATGQTPLNVAEVDGGAGGLISLAITMPADMKCVGGSPGLLCTVRCINPKNYGGCFAVQQTDTAPTINTPANIPTKASLAAIYAQVRINNKDLKLALKANQVKGEGQMAVAAANALVANNGGTVNRAANPSSTPGTPNTPKSGAERSSAVAVGYFGLIIGIVVGMMILWF